MNEISVPVLAGIIFAAICAVLLIAVGVMNIRSGRKALERSRSEGQVVAWHKQVLMLFGLNNIVFACLLVLLTLLIMIANPGVKYAIIALIALLFLASIVLVASCVSSALQTSRNLVSRPGEKSQE
ncbi:hypothetical protein KDW_21210 [Dictyobacter vulcani]|uniref:DUF2721 domain-containing protein n=1 Tax=Dictyobacter vulcani TaxID=2607529 RepID=A0A5J4KPC4_9CHLR|nr:hypothetical protein [Dictyobacter vulcani]GER87959.1 hypothetical protein KDW_21210 [Dictyobacter vulcani]